MSLLDRVLLLLTGLLAAYQLAFGLGGLDTLPVIAYTIAFGVLLIAGLLLIILGFGVLDFSSGCHCFDADSSQPGHWPRLGRSRIFPHPLPGIRDFRFSCRNSYPFDARPGKTANHPAGSRSWYLRV